MIWITLISVLYILVNLYVTKRINASYYLDESRRRLHLKFIWFLPFLGALLIRGHWKKKDGNLDIHSKATRKAKSNHRRIGPSDGVMYGGDGT